MTGEKKKCPPEIVKQSQKLYNVTCEIQQIRCHVNDLIKNTCPGHSAYVSVHVLALRAQVAFFTQALVGSDADAPMPAGWLAFCDSAEVSFPAGAAAALARRGTVAIPTEPGTLGGQRLCRLDRGSALLGMGRSFGIDELVELSIVSLGHTLTA